MNHQPSERSQQLLDQVEAFQREEVVPVEASILEQHETEPTAQPAAMEHLKAKAKAAGLWNLCVRHPDYGPALSMTDYAPLAEAMGTSPVLQEAMNCDAPSSINGDALIAFGSAEQRGRWLEPQLDGQIRSAFGMTEPDVASSDASNIAMSVTRDGSDWILDGRKWWISGVLHPNCSYLMVMAQTDPDASSHRRHTVFVVPRDADGLEVVRNLPKFGYVDPHGHCELRFNQVRLPADAVLGDIGGGFAIGQARLGPARVHHCMRTIGLAEAALSLLCDRAEDRVTFGSAVADRANIQDWIAEARIDIDAARLLTLRTASVMDHEGDKAAAPEMSLIKVQVMRAATTVVDRAIQVHGAAGVSPDTPLARWYANLRGLRIADGPDEVHLSAIARRERRRQQERRATGT